MRLELFCVSSLVQCALGFVVLALPTLPPNDASWEELLSESVHLLQINQDTQMSAQTRLPWHALQTSAKLVAVAVREPSRHKSLLAAGVVQPLMFTTANDANFAGSSIAEYTAAATVALIGRNENGLTLSNETVCCVLDSYLLVVLWPIPTSDTLMMA